MYVKKRPKQKHIACLIHLQSYSATEDCYNRTVGCEPSKQKSLLCIGPSVCWWTSHSRTCHIISYHFSHFRHFMRLLVPKLSVNPFALYVLSYLEKSLGISVLQSTCCF